MKLRRKNFSEEYTQPFLVTSDTMLADIFFSTLHNSNSMSFKSPWITSQVSPSVHDNQNQYANPQHEKNSFYSKYSQFITDMYNNPKNQMTLNILRKFEVEHGIRVLFKGIVIVCNHRTIKRG